MSAAWAHVVGRDVGSLDSLSEILAREAQFHVTPLPDLRTAETLVLLSDYAGSHVSATHEVYSFLLFSPDSMATWNLGRSRVRETVLGRQRRMSYTGLRDAKRRAAIPQFLAAADTLNGLIASFVVSKDVGSLFLRTGTAGDQLAEVVARWKAAVHERLERVFVFASFLLAGLSAPGQNVWWFSDEDEIFPNDERLRDAVDLFANYSSHFLGHQLGHLRIGTAALDSGDLQLEDLLSIPDLVAGSLAEMARTNQKDGISPLGKIVTPPSALLPRKAHEILAWLSNRAATDLKSLSYLVGPSATGGLNWKRLHVHSVGPELWQGPKRP